MKVLNLYAGIGGNRKLWEDVEVTAVEIDPKIAEIYQDFFPGDKVIVDDAHQYLLDHFNEFDFIWASPPCPTHSRLNTALHHQGYVRYPDMNLYQEIIFLKQWFKGQFCIENVISYYDPLIKPVELGRHYFWANFFLIPFDGPQQSDFNITNSRESTRKATRDYVDMLEKYHGVSLKKYNGVDKKLLLRNMVYPPLGKHILNCARGNTIIPLTTFSKSLRMEVK